MCRHHHGLTAYTQALDTERLGLDSLLDLLKHFLFNFFELLIFLNDLPGLDLGSINPSIEPLSNSLLARVAFGLLESEHVLEAPFMYAVITVSQHQSLRMLFYPHVTVGALGRLLQCLIPRALLLISYFFKGNA